MTLEVSMLVVGEEYLSSPNDTANTALTHIAQSFMLGNDLHSTRGRDFWQETLSVQCYHWDTVSDLLHRSEKIKGCRRWYDTGPPSDILLRDVDTAEKSDVRGSISMFFGAGKSVMIYPELRSEAMEVFLILRHTTLDWRSGLSNKLYNGARKATPLRKDHLEESTRVENGFAVRLEILRQFGRCMPWREQEKHMQFQRYTKEVFFQSEQRRPKTAFASRSKLFLSTFRTIMSSGKTGIVLWPAYNFETIIKKSMHLESLTQPIEDNNSAEDGSRIGYFEGIFLHEKSWCAGIKAAYNFGTNG
ncbi:hypothetical protein C8Q75DRAFT_732726 [Abortiporus biennis]|nr:hypothetical protein C8Q75DRAFT_732726 [Abortiporus biennis]